MAAAAAVQEAALGLGLVGWRAHLCCPACLTGLFL